MNDLSLDKLIDLLKEPSLQLSFVENAGGNHPSQRANLRHELLRLLKLSPNSDLATELLRLEKVPSLPGIYSSLSHCNDQGVVALCARPIGVDLEEISRVQEKLVLRVSQDRELLGAANPASLWVAKEAGYKALRSFSQPSLMSQVEIGGWKKLTSQFETFDIQNIKNFANQKGQGLVFQNSTHALGIFIFSSPIRP